MLGDPLQRYAFFIATYFPSKSHSVFPTLQMNPLVVFYSFCAMYGADVQAHQPILQLPEAQSECMRRCVQPNFLLSAEHQNRFWRYLCADRPRNDNPCTWRGVTCVAEVMTTLVFLSTSNDHVGKHIRSAKRWTINPNWLPSGLQNIHLGEANYTEDMQLQRLPRELRYFCAYDLLQAKGQTARLNLRLLPRKLEEFIVLLGRAPATVLIADLPTNMRLLYMRSISLKKAYVDSSSVPKSLENAVICGMHGSVQMHSVDGEALDDRFVRQGDPNALSARYAAYTRQQSDIYLEVNQE